MLNIFINHTALQVNATTLAQLCDEQQLARHKIAIAINHIVIPRSAYENTPLHDNDVIDVITAIQGG